jgi:hypothetical protein
VADVVKQNILIRISVLNAVQDQPFRYEVRTFIDLHSHADAGITTPLEW